MQLALGTFEELEETKELLVPLSIHLGHLIHTIVKRVSEITRASL